MQLVFEFSCNSPFSNADITSVVLNKMKVQLKIFSKSPHVSAIISGFLILQEKGQLSLDIKECYSDRISYLAHHVEAKLNGATFAFDLLDGYNWNESAIKSYLETIDFYFKRSFSDQKNLILPDHIRSKVRPLGFNYQLTYPGNPIDRITTLQEFRKRVKDKILGNYTSHYFKPEIFEGCADFCGTHPSILFFTRLWCPDHAEDSVNIERAHINRMRINIVRKLRNEYGERFLGGIQKDSYSIKECPDLLLTTGLTDRKSYIETMKRSDICIGSMGLHGSIGWKTGEYVAAARAIVSERFRYQVPGAFEDGANYLGYDSVEECLTAVRSLVENPNKIVEMQRRNESYYQKYLRPEMLVLNALNSTDQ